MAIHSLGELLVHELKDLYDAEHQLTKALPKMAKAATSSELKSAFESHLNQTMQHIERLKQVFASMDVKAARETCEAMQGLVKEGSEVLEEAMNAAIRDAALIAAAQRIEHYEIAGYGTARTFAYLLENSEAANLLQQTLDEEEQTDKKLTQIANSINAHAMRKEKVK